MPNPTGHRDSIKNSQFKAAWQSGPTRTIRVPIALAEVTLEYARQLDQSVEPRDTREISNAGIDAVAIEPRDTEINADNQVDNPIDAVAIEPRDTAKLWQELAQLRSQLEKERANREEVEAEREDLAQLKKQVKEHALEVHLEGRSVELQKDRWQGELSEARSELAAAKATINQLKGKIVELERGYTLKPNPAERRLRLEIGELQAQLSDLKQNSAAASELPEAADLLNRLKVKRKKSSATLTDIEAILEMIEES